MDYRAFIFDGGLKRFAIFIILIKKARTRHVVSQQMNNYNPNIHHRRSIRLKGYDYSREGLYFITICLKDRRCLFGRIAEAENFQSRHKMILNDLGKIANYCWLEIPVHFPNVILHEHIVMPNRVHGIIELNRNDMAGTRHIVSLSGNNKNPVQTSHVMSVQCNPVQNQFSRPIPGSISVIIQQYKSSVTRFINKNIKQGFEWQSRFYEHVIRDEQSYGSISDCIINNPTNWKNDDFFDFE